MDKKNVKHFISAALLGTMGVVLFVYIMDPFLHYHSPWLGTKTYLYNAVYQTAGAARNLSYDSAIVGTSMTENFRTSWFDDGMGWNTVKLSYAGARTNDLDAILEQVFLSGNRIENILMDVNEYQLTVASWTAYAERPEYLYDDNPFNDVEYVLNKDIVCTAMGKLIADLKGREDNVDTAYCWEDPQLFGRQKVFDIMRDGRSEGEIAAEFEENKTEILEECRRNLENVGKHIQANPDTTFYIFYPPYSILYWEELIYRGKIDTICEVYQMSMEYFAQFENVRLFFFMDEQEMITDLDQYRDACHHTPDINRYIYECISQDQNEIDGLTGPRRLSNLKQYVQTYDYDSLWELDEY